MLRYPFVFFLLIILPGCLLGQKTRMEAQDNTTVEAPKLPDSIKTDPVQRMEDKQRSEKDKREIKEEIAASSNATRNQMSGLVTTSVSKLGEIVKGVEANLSELLKVEANLDVQARTDLQAALKLMAELKVELNNTLTISNKVADKMDSLLKINASMELKLGNIETNMQAQGQGAAGWRNKMEQKLDHSVQTFTSKAGRDVNMLPKSAVDMSVSMAEKAVGMLTLFCGVFSAVVAMTFRYSRQRAEERAKAANEEKQFYHKALMTALTHVPPEKASEMEAQIEGRKNDNA